MKIFTENEIIVQKTGEPLDRFYSGASGSLKKKAKGFIQSGKIQGLLDTLGSGNQGPSPSPVSTAPASPSPKKGLSTGAKIGIAVGIAAAIGLGVYFYKKSKK